MESSRISSGSEKMADQAGQAGQGANCAKGTGEQRARRFDECGIEEKIARLRDSMLSLSVMAERAYSQAEDAARIAKVHDHGSGGQVVVPLSGPANLLASFDQAHERPFRSIQRLLG